MRCQKYLGKWWTWLNESYSNNLNWLMRALYKSFKTKVRVSLQCLPYVQTACLYCILNPAYWCSVLLSITIIRVVRFAPRINSHKTFSIYVVPLHMQKYTYTHTKQCDPLWSLPKKSFGQYLTFEPLKISEGELKKQRDCN